MKRMANSTSGSGRGWARRFAVLALCAVPVPLIANSHREVGPLSPLDFLSYVVFANAVLTLVLFLMFEDAVQRNRFLVLYNLFVYNLCLAVLLLPARPIDSFIQDIARIRPGMSVAEAKGILKPWLVSGALREKGSIHLSRLDTDIIGYDPRAIGSADEVFLMVKRGRVQSAEIHWD